MTEKKAPVMPDLVRHLGEKSGKDSEFNPYGLPQNDSKKSGKDTGSEAGMTEKYESAMIPARRPV